METYNLNLTFVFKSCEFVCFNFIKTSFVLVLKNEIDNNMHYAYEFDIIIRI
jgi:hypothetical protein